MATATSERIETPPPTVEPEGLYEVVDGIVVEKPPLGAYESELANILGEWMTAFVRANRLGRVLVEMLFDLRPVWLASPETVASAVATPLERQFGRIAGVNQMTSSSSLGSANVTLQFDLNRDIDAASRDVQAAINGARSQLPAYMPQNRRGLPITQAAHPVSKYFHLSSQGRRGPWIP